MASLNLSAFWLIIVSWDRYTNMQIIPVLAFHILSFRYLAVLHPLRIRHSRFWKGIGVPLLGYVLSLVAASPQVSFCQYVASSMTLIYAAVRVLPRRSSGHAGAEAVCEHDQPHRGEHLHHLQPRALVFRATHFHHLRLLQHLPRHSFKGT